MELWPPCLSACLRVMLAPVMGSRDILWLSGAPNHKEEQVRLLWWSGDPAEDRLCDACTW